MIRWFQSYFSVILVYALVDRHIKIFTTLLTLCINLYAQNQTIHFMSWNKQLKYKNICVGLKQVNIKSK